MQVLKKGCLLKTNSSESCSMFSESSRLTFEHVMLFLIPLHVRIWFWFGTHVVVLTCSTRGSGAKKMALSTHIHLKGCQSKKPLKIDVHVPALWAPHIDGRWAEPVESCHTSIIHPFPLCCIYMALKHALDQETLTIKDSQRSMESISQWDKQGGTARVRRWRDARRARLWLKGSRRVPRK